MEMDSDSSVQSDTCIISHFNENDDALSHTLPRCAHSLATRGDNPLSPQHGLGTRQAYQIYEAIFQGFSTCGPPEGPRTDREKL